MKRFFLVVALAAAPMAAMGEQITYVCKLKGKASGWIAEEMVIGVDNDTGQAVIADPIIMFAEEAPKRVEISENTAKKQSFKWDLALRSSTGQTTKMKYRAALQFPAMRLTVYAAPSGYSNNFRMQGNCTITQQKLPDLG